MVDLVKRCLSISYFIGRLTGVLNFEVDFKTGCTRVTTRATICAACSHFVLFILLTHHLINIHAVVKMWEISNVLMEKVFVALAVLRVSFVFLSLYSRWSKRRSFMRLFNSIRQLYSPEILPYCRKSIVSNFLCAIMVTTVHMVISAAVTKREMNLTLAFGTLGVFSVTVIINVIIMQYFIAMASIRGRYIFLNKELQAIVAETRSLNPNRPGVFMTTCCSLADRLEKIAQAQSDLQALSERLTRTFQVEVVCLIINYYSHLVGNLYLIFIVNKHSATTEVSNQFPIVIFTAFLVFQFVNVWMNASNIFYLLDAHEEMVQLLSQRTSFQPGLDQRLEAVIDSFALSLARNPFKLQFLGLFKFDRFAAFALFNSLLSHTILLIQIDIEHF